MTDANDDTLSVTDITDLIKNVVATTLNETVYVTGETANVKLSSQGHLYLTLRDQLSSINVSFWNFATRLKNFKINNGEMVKVKGKIVFMSKTGSYNIASTFIEKQGVGDLHIEYEELREKYKNMGYFDEKIKKQMPKYISNIGIVTSFEGAVIQDMLYVLKDKFKGKIVIHKCIAQGTQCPNSIANGITNLQKWRDNNKPLDVIIVARGGGSFEDLMGYSDHRVIEAIHNSNICVISAVGHETDNMLSDFVADIRAPTPSLAAELIVKQQAIYNNNYNSIKQFMTDNLINTIKSKLDKCKLELNNLEHLNINPSNKIENQLNELDRIGEFITKHISDKLKFYDNKLTQMKTYISKYDICNMLENGYVVLLNGDNIMDSIKNIDMTQNLKIKFKDGEADIVIQNIKPYATK